VVIAPVDVALIAFHLVFDQLLLVGVVAMSPGVVQMLVGVDISYVHFGPLASGPEILNQFLHPHHDRRFSDLFITGYGRDEDVV
jgi:hypothetical protein